jgi:DNA-binding transcriptional LysR family regulator
MKIEERHLAQLAAVVDLGSVTRAAEMLGVSQPAISRVLTSLEKRLGEPLFEPGRRPLRPTLLGETLALHGRQILEASRQATEALRSLRSGSSGTVKVGGVPFFMDAYISRMIGTFHVQEPGIRVDQSYGNLPELQKRLLSHQLDFAICPLGVVEAAPEMEFTEILPARNVLACRRGHPLHRRGRISTRDLVDFPWVAPLPGSPLLADLHAILLAVGMNDISVRYSGGSLMSVYNYLEETDALTVLPHSVVFAHRKAHDISVLPVKIPQPARSLGILRAKNAQWTPAAQKLFDHVTHDFRHLSTMIARHENAIVWGN